MQTRHWLVNNVKLTGNGPYGLEFPTEAITTCQSDPALPPRRTPPASLPHRLTSPRFSPARCSPSDGGPFPAEGSGPHRYTILLLPQPSSFAAPDGLNTPGVAISTMDFPAYITSTGLEAPIAGFYFTVEQGQSSISIEATSAVVTSTLATASASASAAASSGAYVHRPQLVRFSPSARQKTNDSLPGLSSAAVSGSASKAAGSASAKASSASSKAAGASQTAAANTGGAASRVGGAGGVVAFVGAAVVAGLML